MKKISLKNKLTQSELQSLAEQRFGDFVKAVVDVQKREMLVDAELHADQEAAMLESGSVQSNLWGINLYPGIEGDDFIEYDSMINLRPTQGNRSRSVDDVQTQLQIREIVAELIE